VNVAERGEYWARWRPSEVAVRTAEADYTWAEMGDAVSRLAGGLGARGIGAGDRVGILAGNSIEWCRLAAAVMHAGAAVVPLNVRLAGPELGLILEHSGCSAVAYDGALAPLYASAPAPEKPPLTISLDTEAQADVAIADLAQAEAVPSADTPSDAPAVIGYTSGTTGLPKGAMLTHANIAACAQQTALSEGSSVDRRTLLCVPLAFTGGIVNNFLSTYAAGGTLILEPEFVPDRVIDLLERERITTLFAVPVMWQAIAATDAFADADLSALTTAICGGAPVPQKLLDAYLAKDVTIRQAYGLTEATGSVCMLPPELAVDKKLTAGLPNADTRVRLLAEDGSEVETGEVGEITVSGPQVMAGYWNDEQATAEAITDGWLRTGDLGRFDEDGLLTVVDRKKNMFISGGLNVYPAEVERIIDSLPEVAECAVFGIDHERWGEACAAVVRGTGETPVEEQAVIDHCREHLSDYKVPKSVIAATGPLPRGMSGKVLRGEVEELYG
jgi:fatty-acyl-CoA synthase